MSANTVTRLVLMANQIARELASQHPREGGQATYDHIWHYWDPRMRSLILDHLSAGGEGLSDVAREAIEKLQHSTGTPRSVTKATEFSRGVGEGGDESLMSDAG